MKNKAVILGGGILLALAVILGGMYIFEYGLFAPTEEVDEVTPEVKMVTENYKTEFMVYGPEINFNNGCYVRHIDEITESSLTSDESFMYKVLVINDLEGDITFSQDMIDLINDKMASDRVSVVYLGMGSEKFTDTGIYPNKFLGRPERQLLGVFCEKDWITPTAQGIDDMAYEWYLEGNHHAVVNVIVEQVSSSIRHDNK